MPTVVAIRHVIDAISVSTQPLTSLSLSLSHHEQTCDNATLAAEALRYFFDTVGGLIHELDPNHLVESGLLSGGQCGTAGESWSYVSASPGLDVLSYHDYYGTDPLGGDQWNGLAVRLAEAKALNKPIIAGESGIVAGPPNGTNPLGCVTLEERAAAFHAKLEAQLGNGTSGLLVWNYDFEATPEGDCSFNTFPDDPLLTMLYSYLPDSSEAAIMPKMAGMLVLCSSVFILDFFS